MAHYRLYIFDLDGTLYRGADVLPHAVEVLASLRSQGAQVRFLTNNSSQTPRAQQAKLQAFGFEVDLAEILTSGMGAASYLTGRGHEKAFVVGEPGLTSVLTDAGIDCIEAGQADAVVVGICRNLTYSLIDGAMQQISRRAEFVATNTDATYPMEGGRFTPGAGAIVAAVQTCSGRVPYVIGKPKPYLVQMLLAQTQISPSDTLVIGDRYDADILAGIAAGCDTHLVLTGVTAEAPGGQRWSHDLRALLD